MKTIICPTCNHTSNIDGVIIEKQCEKCNNTFKQEVELEQEATFFDHIFLWSLIPLTVLLFFVIDRWLGEKLNWARWQQLILFIPASIIVVYWLSPIIKKILEIAIAIFLIIVFIWLATFLYA